MKISSNFPIGLQFKLLSTALFQFPEDCAQSPRTSVRASHFLKTSLLGRFPKMTRWSALEQNSDICFIAILDVLFQSLDRNIFRLRRNRLEAAAEAKGKSSSKHRSVKTN